MVCPPLSFINVFMHIWKEKVQRIFKDHLTILFQMPSAFLPRRNLQFRFIRAPCLGLIWILSLFKEPDILYKQLKILFGKQLTVAGGNSFPQSFEYEGVSMSNLIALSVFHDWWSWSQQVHNISHHYSFLTVGLIGASAHVRPRAI